MKLIAITGSIATGKSFVLDLFKELGVPTFNCDEELRKIMDNDEVVIKQVKEKFPEAVIRLDSALSSPTTVRPERSVAKSKDDGGRSFDSAATQLRSGRTVKDGALINRGILGDIIFNNTVRRDELESILYPRLSVRQEEFIKENSNAEMIAVEVPLLYEKKSEDKYDAVIVTTVSESIQQERAVKRGINREKLNAILSNQLPSSIKESRADYVIDTRLEKAVLQEKVRAIVSDIRSCY